MESVEGLRGSLPFDLQPTYTLAVDVISELERMLPNSVRLEINELEDLVSEGQNACALLVHCMQNIGIPHVKPPVHAKFDTGRLWSELRERSDQP